MGSRSRKRVRTTAAPSEPRPRGEAANEAARARLKPLAAGERPLAVTIASIVAALLALANLMFLVFGWKVRGQQPGAVGILAFSALMGAASFYMWRAKYWAVLGFQCLLALTCVIGFLSLLRASNAQGFLLSGAVTVASGALFWFLVRALARIQMPQRR